MLVLVGCAAGPLDQDVGEASDALIARKTTKITVRTRRQLLSAVIRADGGNVPPSGHYEPKPAGRPCSWLNGKSYATETSGPDGGTCWLYTTNAGCAPSADAPELCECADVNVTAQGDCTKNGDASTAIDPKGI